MSGVEDPVSVVRTVVPADLPELQRVFRSASLSNPGDAPLLLARPEFLQFAGEGIGQGVEPHARGSARRRSRRRARANAHRLASRPVARRG